MLSTMLPTYLVIADVGFNSNGLYVEVFARWDLPSVVYIERSYIMVQILLSAFLIMKSLSLLSS